MPLPRIQRGELWLVDLGYLGKTVTRLLTLLCFLAPFLAGADTLDIYGQLTGKTALMASGLPRLPGSIITDPAAKTAVPEPKFERASIWFHVSTPLNKSELLYAIETTFALSSFAIIPVDDHSIRLGLPAQAPSNSGGQLELEPLTR